MAVEYRIDPTGSVGRFGHSVRLPRRIRPRPRRRTSGTWLVKSGRDDGICCVLTDLRTSRAPALQAQTRVRPAAACDAPVGTNGEEDQR